MNHKTAYRLQGHLNFQGLEVAVENRKGSVRSGKDKDGKPWRTVMKAPYGYLVGTKGKDGEGIDCYVGPHKDAPVAFVVHQHREDGTGFDEDKIILGCLTEQEARELYLEHYDDPKFLGPIDAVLVEDLKLALRKRNQMNKVTPALVRQQLKTAALADELSKLGYVSADDAHRSLTMLEQLNQQAPKARETAQEAVVGGVGNLATMAIARKIETGKFLKGHTSKEKALAMAADAFKGAIGNVALRAALRKTQEATHKKVLKEYVHEVQPHRKHAATLEELHAAARRIPGVRPTPPAGLLSQMPAFAVPTAAQQRVSNMPVGLRAMEQQRQLLGPELHAQLGSELTPLMSNPATRGTVMVHPSAGHIFAPGQPRAVQQGNYDWAVLHEANERRGGLVNAGSLHPGGVGPGDVLMKDHNMAVTMSGPGGEEVAKSITDLRRPEFQHMSNQFNEAFGPQGQQWVAQGNKIRPAMRRAFSESPVAQRDVPLEVAQQAMQHQGQEIAARQMRAHSATRPLASAPQPSSAASRLSRLAKRLPEMSSKLAFETSAYNGWGTQGAIRTKEDNPYYFGEVRKIPGPYAQPKTAAYTRYVGDGRHHDADEHEVGRKSHPMSAAAAKALGLSTVGVIGGSLLYDLHDASRHGSSALSHAAAEALKKVAMEESQYSAGTDMGPLNARNNQYFPAPLHRPSPYARQKLADPVAERALAAFEKASMTSPAQRLARTQQVATHPGSLGRRGASINQIARTVGMPDPATTKSAL